MLSQLALSVALSTARCAGETCPIPIPNPPIAGPCQPRKPRVLLAKFVPQPTLPPPKTRGLGSR
jgi:hypothetical protein